MFAGVMVMMKQPNRHTQHLSQEKVRVRDEGVLYLESEAMVISGKDIFVITPW